MIRQIGKRLLGVTLAGLLVLVGCSGTDGLANQPSSGAPSTTPASGSSQETVSPPEAAPLPDTTASEAGSITVITPTEQEQRLTDALAAVHYDGDYGFDAFLSSGGASSDEAVVEYLSKNIFAQLTGLSFGGGGFGCSTLAVRDPQGNALFGRNFDWEPCSALIVTAAPPDGYASISTVNLDFLGGYSSILEKLPAKIRTLASLYAPLDGMNEAGLCAAVLVIEDSAVINQSTDKPDITTTTAIRLLLDNAADVPEATALLAQYDMHSSMGMMVHFALSDAQGRSAVVEYVDGTMVVTETPIVTNFYLAQGDKNGIGSSQSHERFDLLQRQLSTTSTMDMNTVRNAMDSVSKDNFGEFESTEWSIVYNQSKGEARYYHREDYENGFAFKLK